MRALALLMCLLVLSPVARAIDFREGVLTTEPGVEIYWRSAGSGPAVIVPGGFLFHDDLDRLASSQRLVLYDVRNRGRSRAISDPSLLTIDGDVRDLEAVREHFGIDRFSTIGYSYLGKMIVLYALRHPQRIERLVQIGAVPMRFDSQFPSTTDNTGEQVMDPAAVARLRGLRAEGMHEKEPRAYCEEEWLVTRVRMVGDARLASSLRSWCDHRNEWPINFGVHLRHHFPSAQKADVGAVDLQRITQPVLTIHGTKDRNAPYGAGREWAAMLPNARLRTVEGGAHQAWADDPSVLDEVQSFLGGVWPERAKRIAIAEEEWLSQLRGVELVRRAAQTHGVPGQAALGLRWEGRLLERSQSRSASPPFDPFPVTLEVLFRAGGDEVAVDDEFHWPDFVSRYRTVYRSGEGFELDLNSRRIVEPYVPLRKSWMNQLIMVPPYLIDRVLMQPQAIRLAGVTEECAMVQGDLEGEWVTLCLDDDHRLRSVTRLVSSSMTGDAVEVTRFEGRQVLGDLTLPRSIQRSLNGVSIAELAVAGAAEPDESRFEVPAGFEQSVAGTAAGPVIESVAENVWLVKNIGGADYRSLVVVHDDGLVVVEAPQSEAAMEEVVRLLGEKFEGRRIKAGVVTHHHFDHAGGARAVMAEGARLYVPAGTAELFRTVATAPRTLEENAVKIDPWSLQIEPVDGAVIPPEKRGPLVQIYSLGPNEHAEGMLFAWIPQHGILFQGDLFVKRREVEPARSHAVVFLHRLEELGLEPKLLIGVHGEIATMEDLRRSVQARALDDQTSILGPEPAEPPRKAPLTTSKERAGEEMTK